MEQYKSLLLSLGVTAIPPPSMPSTASIRRPFGGAVVATVPCRLVPCMWGGRARFNSGVNAFQATHYLEVGAGTNIRDGVGRTLGLNSWVHGDGDEVVVTVSGRVTRFVVVFVEDRFADTSGEYRRAYLLRDSVTTW